ncbi:MAG: NUDIX domain-containing protein [Nocardioidaceae bacterium]|jgi:8-oxo-dGTP pyrophosphatase MutT (NUDIX family)
MVALLNPANDHVAVALFDDPTKSPRHFHRLVGGSVLLGEKAADAARREVREEIGIDLLDLGAALGVLENVFDYRGEAGHEVVFVFAACVDESIIPGHGGWFSDNGDRMWVEWRSLTSPPPIPLYPDGAADLVVRG